MAVFVLDKHHKPLMPCSEKRARLLLNRKRAHVHTVYPFTIRLIDRTVQESALQPVRCKIDPGSKTTGMAIVRENEGHQTVLYLLELTHRGSAIRDQLQARSSLRRHRRSTLQYRPARFANRTRPKGWLAPSLMHRVENTLTWVSRIKKLSPITAITCERVRFDTQKLLNPEIESVEYQRGTLFGCEIREYLLEKWGRRCAYCDVQNVPLQIDHIHPQSCGGSNRIDNLTLACGPCNLKKSNLSVEAVSPKRAKVIRSKPSLQGAAAVNSTRAILWDSLLKLQIPCEAGTGGQTKYNRERFGVPKTHALDAACTGTVQQLTLGQVPTQQIRATGKGSYQRTRSDRFGFPRGILLRQKKVNGFQTGDQVIATVPSGKKQGLHVGRVAIRASGFFNVQTSHGVVQGISSKHCRLVQRANGYHYSGQLPAQTAGNVNILNNQFRERQFLPVLKDWVSLPSIG